MYRKRGRLMQEDVAFISAMPDFANVSRMENGIREPSLELLLLYHLLFEMPIDTLFGDILNAVKQTVIERIRLRIELLESLPQKPKVIHRISTLRTALTRLSSSQ